MRFANGHPALIEKQAGEGHVLLFTSTFDNVWSDFPLHPIFIPLVHQMVRYAGRLPAEPAAYRIPTTIALASYLHGEPGSRETSIWDVTGPDGKRVVPLEQDRRLDYLVLQQPGFYEIREPNSLQLLAANPDPRESDLRQLSKEDRALWVSSAEAIQQSSAAIAGSESEKRQTVWWILLMLALLIALAEIYMANPFLGPRRAVVRPEGLQENPYVSP
jgi:hypothetical protein